LSQTSQSRFALARALPTTAVSQLLPPTYRFLSCTDTLPAACPAALPVLVTSSRFSLRCAHSRHSLQFAEPVLCLSQNLLFKDLSLLLANPKAYGGVIDALVAKYAKRDVTAVVGIGAAFIGV
jgi:hypothetical protein